MSTTISSSTTTAALPIDETLSVIVKPDNNASTGLDGTDPFSQIAEHLKSVGLILKQVQRDLNKKEKPSKKKSSAASSAAGGGAAVPVKNNFSTPVALSEAMCVFLNIPLGSKLARTEVTRQINAYIKEKNLNDPTNKRIIIPDDKLKTILKVDDTVQLTYFNMQTYNKHNFV